MKKSFRVYENKYMDQMTVDFGIITIVIFPNGGDTNIIKCNSKKEVWNKIKEIKATWSDSNF